MLSTLNFSNLWSVERKPDFAVHEQQNPVFGAKTGSADNFHQKSAMMVKNFV